MLGDNIQFFFQFFSENNHSAWDKLALQIMNLTSYIKKKFGPSLFYEDKNVTFSRLKKKSYILI